VAFGALHTFITIVYTTASLEFLAALLAAVGIYRQAVLLAYFSFLYLKDRVFAPSPYVIFIAGNFFVFG
jgi:hypothetical protein